MINYINDCNESYLSEAFKGLSLLEDDINLSNIGDDLDDELSAMVSDDVEAPVEEIVDINADEETELSDTYEGKVILECNCCHSRIYKDGEEVIIEEDTANPDDECPVCGNTCGYTVIGKIQKFDDNKEVEPEEDEDDEHEDEEEKNESLTEGAMSLKDRLARKHLFDAEESFDEEPIEESAINEDNWDKLTDAYPELEDGEIHEEMGDAEEVEESAELTELFGFGKKKKERERQAKVKGDYENHRKEIASLQYKIDFNKEKADEARLELTHAENGTYGYGSRRQFYIDQAKEDLRRYNAMVYELEQKMRELKKKEVDTSFDDYESDRDSWDSMAKSHADETDKRLSKIARQQNDQDNYKARLERDRAEQRKHDEYKARTGRDWYDRPAQDHEFRSGEWRPVEEDLGDDAADFLWEGNKITVDGEDYEIISMGADVLTVEDADGQTVEFDLAELAGKPYSVVDYDGEYYEHKPSVGESLTEDDELSGKLDKKSRKLIYDGDDAYEAAKIDLIKLKGSKKIKWAELHPNKNETPSPEALKHFEITYELGESFTEDDDEDICPECGKKPCDCEKHEHHHGHHCEEGCGKRVDEAVEVHASGEDEVDVAKNDDGSMTINVGQTQVEGESIVPLSDEDQTALEANTAEEEPAEDEFADEEAPAEESEAAEEETEEEAPAEEGEEENTQEESYSITNFNEHKFNDLVEGFLRKVYENVNTFETTRVQDADDKFFVEGLIKYKSGKAANTRFVFENAFFSKNGSLVMEGYNSTFSNNGKSFRIRGSLNKGNFVTESMIYNYNVKQLNEANKQETVTISGRVKAR